MCCVVLCHISLTRIFPPYDWPPSSSFPWSNLDDFLAERPQFDSYHCVDFSAPTCCQSANFVRPLFAFYCPLVFTEKKNNAAFRHRRNVYAARLIDLRNRSIALRERWCHRSTAYESVDGDTVDGATVVGWDPAFIQPVHPRVLY